MRLMISGTFANASTVEVYGALTYKIVTFKYNRSTGNFLGNLDSSGSQYFDLSAAFDRGGHRHESHQSERESSSPASGHVGLRG